MTTQKYKIENNNSCYYSTFGCYTVNGNQEFDNRDDAVAAAKKLVSQRKDDVTIWKIDSVAKFPIGDIEIETVV